MKKKKIEYVGIEKSSKNKNVETIIVDSVKKKSNDKQFF